jgi:preprotein translocase subunit SecE
MVNPTATKKRPRFKFIRETIAELKKVVWLTRREALYLTSLVILVAVAVGAILGGIDYLFSMIVDKLLIGS